MYSDILQETKGMIYSFSNDYISELLRNVAVAYAIKDEKKHHFQIIAYQNASNIISASPTQVIDLYKTNRLDELEGVGPSICASLIELFTTGKAHHLEEVLKTVPKPVFPLLDIPSFGPKKAYKLVTQLNLHDPSTVIKDIVKLAQQGRISGLEGFGKKSESDLLRTVKEYKSGKTKNTRMLLPYASEIANKMVTYLKTCPSVDKVSVLGSLRRQKSTIGDIDIAVTTNKPYVVLDHFVAYPHKERIIERGEITSSILLTGGKQIDLMVLPPDSFGSLLQHFTGSKEHNITLREYALKKGLSLSEKGIKVTQNGKEKMLKFSTEKNFYHYLGLEWIPPEIREDHGEIALAEKHRLPQLVITSDMKGDLHIHTNYPMPSSHDYGAGSIQDMIDKAKLLGYKYIGISDHNPRATNISKHEIYSILSKRKQIIDQINESNKSIHIFNLLEQDILASGDLTLDDKALEFVDAVLASIHSSFAMDKNTMTKRILKGLSHPKVKIFSHPTGRLINKRPGYDADWSQIFKFAAQNNKALEINAWPERLDLPDLLVMEAKKHGVHFVINTDSHDISHMDNMAYGVSVARRGWCTPEDVLNTLSLKRFGKWLLSQ